MVSRCGQAEKTGSPRGEFISARAFKARKQKAENKAALCVKAGCSVSVCVSIFNSPPAPSPSLAKTRL